MANFLVSSSSSSYETSTRPSHGEEPELPSIIIIIMIIFAFWRNGKKKGINDYLLNMKYKRQKTNQE